MKNTQTKRKLKCVHFLLRGAVKYSRSDQKLIKNLEASISASINTRTYTYKTHTHTHSQKIHSRTHKKKTTYSHTYLYKMFVVQWDQPFIKQCRFALNYLGRFYKSNAIVLEVLLFCSHFFSFLCMCWRGRQTVEMTELTSQTGLKTRDHSCAIFNTAILSLSDRKI